jgi:hypothetical protein
MKRKKKQPAVSSDDRDAGLWASPEMQNLDKLTRQVLKVPKSELERLEAEERKTKGK